MSTLYKCVTATARWDRIVPAAKNSLSAPDHRRRRSRRSWEHGHHIRGMIPSLPADGLGHLCHSVFNSREVATMRNIIAGGVAVEVGLGLSLLVYAQKPTAPNSGEEPVFRKLLDAYEAAYNKGDVDGLMSFWAEGSEFVSEDGDVIRGKKALAEQFRKVLSENK